MTDDLRSTVGAVWLNHQRQGNGDPLILLHSLGGSLIQWAPVMDWVPPTLVVRARKQGI